MSYIQTGIKQPGIVELLFYKDSTGRALSHLADTILLGPSPLSSGERELIASYVSNLNQCEFCHKSHSAAVNEHLKDNGQTIACVIENIDTSTLSPKMKALLKIAGKVQKSGKNVTKEDIESAKIQGANDEEIHDTVIVAAAFCMFNRYVDGLGIELPLSDEEYIPMGKRMAKGYKLPPKFISPFIKWFINRA